MIFNNMLGLKKDEKELKETQLDYDSLIMTHFYEEFLFYDVILYMTRIIWVIRVRPRYELEFKYCFTLFSAAFIMPKTVGICQTTILNHLPFIEYSSFKM